MKNLFVFMQKILVVPNFIPQGDTQCQVASFCIAVSVLMKNKYGIDFVLDPNVVEKMGESLSFTPSEWIAQNWHLLKLPKIEMGKIMKPLNFFTVRKYLNEDSPVMIQIDNWDFDEDTPILTKGTRTGHWVVVVGYDTGMKTFFVVNPWGKEFKMIAERKILKKVCGMGFCIQ